ncbi:MAG: single-stranded DNA-binding protein [Holosporaceae bacterium]
MAASMNRVMLLGNLTRDVEVRHSNDGSKIVTLSLATSEQWRDKNTGERKERAEYHRVVIFNERLANLAEQYLKKGRKVYLEGQMQTRKWTDQSGQERYVTEVVLQRFRGELLLLDRADASGGGGESFKAAVGSDVGPAKVKEASASAAPADAKAAAALEDFDDDIPF